MYYLNEYNEEKNQGNLNKINDYVNTYNNIPKTELFEIFNELLNSFDKNKIFFPYLEYHDQYLYNVLSFSTTTRDEKYEEKLNKVKDFDFDISFAHTLEQYDIKYSRNNHEHKEYLSILVSSCSRIYITNYTMNGAQPMKNFHSNDKKCFELIIYSRNSIYIKLKNGKIIPFKLSNISYYPTNIFKILFEIFSKYSPIYKDILRENFLLSNPFGVLNIDFETLNSCHTKKQVLEKIFNINLYNSINSFSLYEGYIICCALKLVKENYYCDIYKHAKYLKSIRGFFENGFSYSNAKKDIGLRFLNSYYMKKTEDYEFRGNIYQDINDFLEYEYKTKKCIELNVKSLNKIRKYAFYSNVEENAKKKKSFRISKKNNFTELELPEGFNRIKNKKELIELSKKMKIDFFCNTYNYAKIKTDQYAVYTIKINSDVFAVIVKQIQKENNINNKHHTYSLVRVQGHSDKRVPWELRDDINRLIKYNNKHKLGGLINEL